MVGETDEVRCRSKPGSGERKASALYTGHVYCLDTYSTTYRCRETNEVFWKVDIVS